MPPAKRPVTEKVITLPTDALLKDVTNVVKLSADTSRKYPVAPVTPDQFALKPVCAIVLNAFAVGVSGIVKADEITEEPEVPDVLLDLT